MAVHREAGCDSGQILFCDADIQILIRELLCELVQNSESKIARQQHDATISGCGV